jgi:hypothetical protein
MTSYKLGKHPPRNDKRTLKLGDYIQPALPTPPTSVDWTAKVTCPWTMMGNDQYGDCTCAGAGHLIMDWTANAATCFTPTDDQILTAYNAVDGGADRGANMTDVLNYWRQTGIGGHTITAYAQVDMTNLNEIRQTIDLFGGCYIGVALPDFITQSPDPLAVSWVAQADSPPNPDSGHCIPLVGYDTTGVTVITWGAAIHASWDFITTYSDEGFAVLSNDWIEASGGSPNGFDLASLQADLAAVTA